MHLQKSAINLMLLCAFFIFFFNTFANSKIDECYWDNKQGIPCLKIKKNISNESKYTKEGIKKYIINKKYINESGAIDLVDVLRTVPSLHITQSGPRGQTTSIFMRGTNSNHTLVLINGIPINDQSTTQGLHNFGVDFIQAIQQIEIYPGPSATHFGTNAIGGAINIIVTGDYQNSYSFKGKSINNFDIFANKSYLTSNDYALNFKLGLANNETNSAKHGGSEKDNTRNITSNFNLEKYINENLKIFSNTYLRQTISEYDGSSSNEFHFKGDDKMITTQHGLKYKKNNKENNFIFYYNGYDREYDEQGIFDNYYSEAFGSKYEFKENLNNFSYGFGTDYRYDWGKFNNRGSYTADTKGHFDNLALYANLGIDFFNDVNISLFLRSDEHKITERNNTYKTSISKRFNKLKLGLIRMTGLRNPSLYEFYGTDSYGYSGNKDLKPEKSTTNEIFGDIVINDNFIINLKAYRSSIQDYVEYSSNKYINNKSKMDLLQSGYESEIIMNKLNNQLRIYGALTSSKKVGGTDQTRRPEKTYGFNFFKKLKLDYLGEASMNINYKHYGKHFDIHSSNFSTVEMDSTDILNLNLSKIINNINYSLNINNLFDENYQRPHGYEQNGRDIRISLKRSF